MKKQGAHGGNAPAEQGARGGNAHGAEGLKHTGKTNHETASLRTGSLPGAVKVPNGLGLGQSSDPAPSGESNHESLRHGSKPAAERVKSHPTHSSVQRAAHNAYEASKGQPSRKR
jgi:hypothetical protein